MELLKYDHLERLSFSNFLFALQFEAVQCVDVAPIARHPRLLRPHAPSSRTHASIRQISLSLSVPLSCLPNWGTAFPIIISFLQKGYFSFPVLHHFEGEDFLHSMFTLVVALTVNASLKSANMSGNPLVWIGVNHLYSVIIWFHDDILNSLFQFSRWSLSFSCWIQSD